MPNTSTRQGLLAAVVAGMSVACGGDSRPEPGGPAAPPSSPPPSGVVQIRGTERLGWSQIARSAQEARAHVFNLYVDGTRNTVADVECVVGGATEFSCSGRLPSMTAGRHTLELSATLNGMESPRSAPLLVERLAAQAAGAASAAPTLVPLVTCEGEQACYAVQTVAQAGTMTWLTALPDGRVAYVEDDRRIRLVAAGRLLADAALALDESARIAGLAADPQFERTRQLFVAWSAPSGEGEHRLSITRYREVDNVLGEPATVISGIPVPDSAAVPIAIGGEEQLYVAVPAFTDDRAASQAFGGRLLRFTADGRVPAANRSASPVVAYGFEQPSALLLDPAGGLVWLAGTRQAWPHSVAAVPTRVPADAPWPYVPSPAASAAFLDRRAPSLAFLDADGARGSLPSLHAIAPPAILRLDRGLREIQFSGIERPVAIADAHDGTRYVVAGSSPAMVLLQLTRRD